MMENNALCLFISESIQKCRSYGSDEKLALNVALILNLLEQTPNRDGGQLCQIILKSNHNCRSYGPEIFGCTQALVNTRNMCVRDTDAPAKWYWSQVCHMTLVERERDEKIH